MSPFIQGIGIGFAIAAPVGPIGMLCIRRTLRDGPAVGLATGLGAACADASYGLLVASGLSWTGWLLDHAVALGLIGAALLGWLGLGALRSARTAPQRLADGAQGAAPPAPSRGAAFASTYALTLSNPATILSFVGVIAALGSVAGADATAAIALVAGVLLGSTLWWLTLVGIVARARRRVTAGALRAIDLVTGLVLIGTALWVASRSLGALA